MMVYFTKDHEWALINDSIATIGITDYAQKHLGDVVYLELPEPGAQLEQGKVFGVVESVKAVSDLFAPISGKVIETHRELVQNPEQLNADPENKAWMLKIAVENPAELKTLMKRAEYELFLREETK